MNSVGTEVIDESPRRPNFAAAALIGAGSTLIADTDAREFGHA
ncbi:hypothetical protein WKW77_25870 [Variovorax ureilyticus]|uniref:Uncharacterized protein n=1 Tax=Variovorax ureilyticus TaxID=1836198 RepID=A0ABU8VMJ1_9BURK